MTHDRKTCSIGWPRPRSVASEKAATSSANATPESRSPASTAQEYELRRWLGCNLRIVLWGELRTTPIGFLRTVGAQELGQEDTMSVTTQRRPAESVARWSIGGVFLESLAERDYRRM